MLTRTLPLLVSLLTACPSSEEDAPGRTVRAQEVSCDDLAVSYGEGTDRHVDDLVLDGVDVAGWSCLRSSEGMTKWTSCHDQLRVEDGALWFSATCVEGEGLRVSWW